VFLVNAQAPVRVSLRTPLSVSISLLISLLLSLPASAAGASPPLFEAQDLAVRFAPSGGGVTLRAARVAWRDASWQIEVLGLDAALRPAKEGKKAFSVGARSIALEGGAPSLGESALTGTFVRAAPGRPWAVPDLALRIGGVRSLSGAIVGPPSPAASKRDEAGIVRVTLASHEGFDLAALSPALGWFGAKGWRASGRARFSVDARVPTRIEAPAQIHADVALRGFAFSSPGNTPDLAADRLNGNLSFAATGTLTPRRIRFALEADAADFEILSGVYYASFAGKTVLARMRGSLEGARVEGLDALFTAPGLGTVRIEGAVGPARKRPGDTLRLRAERLDLARLWTLAVSEPLGDAHRWIAGSTLRGTARLDARWNRLAAGWTLEGLLEGSKIRWERPAARALLDVPEARLPFHVRTPSRHVVPDPATVGPAGYGKIRVARFRAGSWSGENVVLEPLIREGGIRLRGPLVVPFYGGAIRVEDLEGSDIFEEGRRLTFRGHLSRIDLAAFTRGLGLPDFRGTLEGGISEVRIDGDRLRAPGRFETAVFGGTIALSALSVEHLFSTLPRIHMDVAAREVSLREATQALLLGRMSGTLEGSIRGLVIERGEPQAFFADFSVVDRKGVAKWVSADFVEDIATLFGSGNAVSTALNRGVNRLLDRYRYDAFGFTCRLHNDVFYPRGKIRRDGTEYLMWGSWNYVRIVIRDPGRGIPFSFVVRQVRVLSAPTSKLEHRSRTPLNWLWPPSWREPRGPRAAP